MKTAAERAAREVLANCSARYVRPEGFEDTPQKVIDVQIANAAAIISREYRELERKAEALANTIYLPNTSDNTSRIVLDLKAEIAKVRGQE